MLKDIVEVRVPGGHRLHVRFEDGVVAELDLSDRLSFDGVFASLKDPREFAKAHINAELGTVCWPNGADLDPDVLYAMATGTTLAADSRSGPAAAR